MTSCVSPLKELLNPFYRTDYHSKVTLEEIRSSRGDINEIRMLLKGNVKVCHKLFKQALEEGDVISQIQLSHTLFGMKWGGDDKKDFSTLIASNLKTFSYHFRAFSIFNSAYDQVMGGKSYLSSIETRTRVTETFRMAANRGCLRAFLELKNEEWGCRSYGFAVQLRPFVGKGDRRLDFYFGQALKEGVQVGSELYYEGLYWMNQSSHIQIKCPEENECFELFKSRYITVEYTGNFYEHDGFLHAGTSVILAPSQEAWKTFVKEKLEAVKVAPIESYLFEYDAEQIKLLYKKYKITTYCSIGDFVESSEGREREYLFGKNIYVLGIYPLLIYINNEQIGKISVQENTFKIYQTFKNENIQPIIDFIENVMSRTGSAHSAESWLNHLVRSEI